MCFLFDRGVGKDDEVSKFRKHSGIFRQVVLDITVQIGNIKDYVVYLTACSVYQYINCEKYKTKGSIIFANKWLYDFRKRLDLSNKDVESFFVDKTDLAAVGNFIKNKIVKSGYDFSRLFMVMTPGDISRSKSAVFLRRGRYGIIVKVPKSLGLFSKAGPFSKVGRLFRFVSRSENDYHFPTREELVVFAAGHEFGHYLMFSGQLDKLNSETNADKFGYQWVKDFNSRKKIKEMIRVGEMMYRNRKRRLILI